MRHLVKSFQEHGNARGVHFYDEESCNFLPWGQVLKFLEEFPENTDPDTFRDNLTEVLANYDPRFQFLAVRQMGDKVSVELYEDPTAMPPRGKTVSTEGLQ